MSNDAKYVRTYMVKQNVYMCIDQIPLILYTSYVDYSFKMKLVELSGNDGNSLWSYSESLLWKKG